jgi:hypothetical protein
VSVSVFYLRGSGETAVNHWHEKGFSVSLPTAKKCSLNIPAWHHKKRRYWCKLSCRKNRVQDEGTGGGGNLRG